MNASSQVSAPENEVAAKSTIPDDPAPLSKPLALPATASNDWSHVLDVGEGGSVKLDHLGPMVVNQDGTLSRISNWNKMSDDEQKNTVRVIGKRNQQRLAALKKTENGSLGESP